MGRLKFEAYLNSCLLLCMFIQSPSLPSSASSFFFFHFFLFFLLNICIPCIVLVSKNWQKCQKTAHLKFSVQIQLNNILNLEQLKMGCILQNGSWQSILWISLLLQKLPCSTISQLLHVIMCNHNWKFTLKGKKFWLLLSGDKIMCYEMLCKLWNATEMYTVFCCYSSTMICSDFCCFFSWFEFCQDLI